jgi:riboflavin biosynthesis pyrimidine reductase
VKDVCFTFFTVNRYALRRQLIVSVAEFADQKTREADAAALLRLETVEDRSAQVAGRRLGNAWSRRHYGGDFLLVDPPPGLPAVSLVFVESRDGNTGAHNPEELGGGPTDKHFIYEGLSRVAADAVLAGASTASGKHAFFSVWRRELVEMRRDLGLSRHPAQVVVSGTRDLDVAGTLLYNVPEVPVIVIAGDECRQRCGNLFRDRSWITVIPFAGNWTDVLATLCRDHGIGRISAIGGRKTATSLIDAGVVQDICLTKTQSTAGEPNTPYYTGNQMPAIELIVKKQQPKEAPRRRRNAPYQT